MSIELKQIQETLKREKIDGWLLYDFQGNNPIARRLLQIPLERHLTRRFFYWIPKEGQPVKIVHRIESKALDELPGEKRTYLRWEELGQHLKEVIQRGMRVAMEYSPRCALPYISKVDAGTIEWVRSLGGEIVSSAAFLQEFTARWDEAKWLSHLAAATYTNRVVDEAWQLLKEGKPFTEYSLQQWILKRFEIGGFYTEWDPICAVGAHSADPHYTPSKENSLSIQPGDFLLIDLGCKEKKPHAVYADFTRVAVLAEKPSQKQKEVFEIVKNARDAAIDLVKQSFSSGKEVRGCDVDRATRSVIDQAGYGEYFIHRTGHNIDEEVHGPGAHLDSLETLDERPLIPMTCFSVEPGIYLPGEFGVRLECDVYISPQREIIVTGMVQEAIASLA